MSRAVKQLALVTSVAVLSISFTGCQYRSKSDVYVLVAPNLKLPYWKAVEDGFSQAATEYGVTARIVGPDTYNPSAEADAFSKAVASRPAGILVAAADAGALRDDISSAISAGVPVITVDSDAPLSSRLYYIGTNNLEAGHVGGMRLVDRIHGKGNVVFFSIKGQPNLEDRLRGYMGVFAEHPGIKIVDVVSTGGDSGSAFDRSEEFVHRSGADRVDAFVALESSSGKAIAEVLKRNNASDREVIAMDVDPDTLNLIESGAIDATISQKPFTMGYVGLKQLDMVHHSHSGKGEFRSNYATDVTSPYPEFVDTGSTLITKDNVSLFQHPSK